MYGIYDSLGVRLQNGFRLSFRHFRENKFRHDFADTLNQFCPCSFETEDTERYLRLFQDNLSFCITLYK